MYDGADVKGRKNIRSFFWKTTVFRFTTIPKTTVFFSFSQHPKTAASFRCFWKTAEFPLPFTLAPSYKLEIRNGGVIFTSPLTGDEMDEDSVSLKHVLIS